MGKIFTYAEVEDGRVPNDADFLSARDQFSELARVVVQDGVIDGAFIFGSVAYGVANRRSDMDVFISLADSDIEYFEAIEYLLSAVTTDIDDVVPLSAVVHTKSSLEDGNHDIDRLFGSHLSSQNRIIIGSDPSQYMTFRDQTTHDIFSAYIFQKKRRLTETYMNYQPLDLSGGGLQRLLELPQALGRKTIQAFTEHQVADEPALNSADKTTVINRSRELLDMLDLASVFNRIVELNILYDDTLKAAIENEIEQEDYEDFIKSMHAMLPAVIVWLEQVSKEVLPYLNKK